MQMSKTPDNTNTAAGNANEAAEAVTEYIRRSEAEKLPQHWHLNGTGPVRELEEKLETYWGFDHALCVSSATMGIRAVFQALGLAEETFITTRYTWGGTIAGPIDLGARPVFAGICPDTLGIDPASLEQCAEEHPSAEAILAVDAFGIPSDSKNLRRVADEKGLIYIGDAAQSFGARRNGAPPSRHADVCVTSFTAEKALFAGEGGAVLTSNRELYERLIWQCQHPRRQKREIGLTLTNELALNARINPVAAIWANEQFGSSLEDVGSRRRVASDLISGLSGAGLVQAPNFASREIEPSYFRIPLRPTPSVDMTTLRDVLHDQGFTEATLHEGPVLLFNRFPEIVTQDSPGAKCSEAKSQAENLICVSGFMQ